MISKILLSLFGLIIAGSISAKMTHIGGHFQNPNAKNVTIQYYASSLNFIETATTLLEVEIDSNNNFLFEIESDVPINFHLLNGENWLFINKYAGPGDSIWFKFNNDTIIVNGNCEDCLDFMFQWEDKFMESPIVNQEYNSTYQRLEPKEFALYWNKRRKDQLLFLSDFFKNKTIPKIFKDFIEAEINYKYAVAMLQYSWRKTIKEPILNDSEYLKFLDEIIIDNQDASTMSGAYLHFLRELPYCMYKNDITYNKKKKRKQENLVKENIYFRDSMAKKYFTGNAYDLALYSILYDQVQSIERNKYNSGYKKYYKLSESIFNNYRTSFNDKKYYDRIIKKLNDLNDADKPAPDFILKDINGKEVRLSDFKGKVIYLDFWATNCAPCVAEIPKAKILKEKFEDKNVVFLYVSLDNSVEKLKGFIDKKSFTGVHLNDPKGLGSEVANMYGVNAIPHYFLIDKNGFIVNGNAPRPSLNPEELIEKLLK